MEADPASEHFPGEPGTDQQPVPPETTAHPEETGAETSASEAMVAPEAEGEHAGAEESPAATGNALPAVPFRVRQRHYRAEEEPVRPAATTWLPQWQPGFLIVPTILLAALLAHGLCVRAIFYLDDWTQIVANDWVDGGWWWEANQHVLTYFTHWLTYALFGMSSPAFHAGNLLLHGIVAVLVSGFARTFLTEAVPLPPERARRIGWWAGLFFAVHPLCSEVLNYTKSRDIELVTLFAVLAARSAVRWRRQRKPGHGWAVATLLAVTAATFCKEVGFIIAAGSVALVWFGLRRPPSAKVRQAVAMPLPGAPKMPKTKLVVAPKDASIGLGNWPVSLSLALVAACVGLAAWPAWQTAYASLHHPRLGWHALTKMRTFWMYLQRVVAPVGLCSDHQVTWTTNWNDPAAWAATAGVAAVLVGTAWFFFRGRGATRAASVLAALVLLDLLHRLANPAADLMVESRMYPAMWPLCVLIAWGIGMKAEGRRQKAEGGEEANFLGVRWAVVLVLVAGCAVLSERRAQVWGSRETLVANIVAQYPFQGRAYQELQDADVRAEYWTETLKDQKAILLAVTGAIHFNETSPVRKYDPSALLITHVQSEGNCALALAELGFKKQAVAHLQWLQQSLHPGNPGAREFGANFLYAAARVNEATGSREEAINNLHQSLALGGGNRAERELRRVEAGR